MSQEILLPDYNHSILNIVSSILKNYNVKDIHPTLPELDLLLEKKYKNIVLLILDGMGENVLNHASSNGILKQHENTTLTSVFPCTTAAALTTYYTGKPPIETGWIGWSQYFKEYGRCVDMLPYVDSYTGDNLPKDKFDVYKLLNYKTTYSQINEASPQVKTYEIKPSHCEMKTDKCIHIKDMKGLCDSIETLCKNDESKYIFAYFDNPDSINHKYGCDSEETKQFILSAETYIENLAKKLENTDTLILISADHGHNNIHNNFNAMDLNRLEDCYIMPPSLEPRFISFWIKHDKKDFFENKFNELFNNEFILYTKEDFLKTNLMGFGTPHKKIDDFLGDYIAIAISDTSINLGTYLSKPKYVKLSNHCGLTRNEMEVPFIVFDLK